MDPSASQCLSYDTFDHELPPVDPDPRQWYTSKTQTQLTAKLSQVSAESSPGAIYCDANKYRVLQQIKDKFDVEGFIEARDATNPFELIGRSIFINRAAVKLANIDAVHTITNHTFTYDNQTNDSGLTFCDVAAGPGGFTQYLQFRFPNAKGYGMTLKHDKLNWNTRVLDMSRFSAFYGDDNSGNLYTNAESFVRFVLEQSPQGVDLVTGDGGFDLEDGTDKTLLHRQEFLSSRLLLSQALIGVGCVRAGGNFVVKVFDTVTEISAQIIFVLAQCFESVLVFKPVSSRPANAERYVLCKNRKFDVGKYYGLLRDAYDTYTDDIFLDTLFEEQLPVEFTQWLTANNVISIDRQLQSASNIIKYLAGQDPLIPAYDINKFLTVWNLPDTPRNPRRSKIQLR